MKIIKNSIVEFLGTIALIFFACGTAITSTTYTFGGGQTLNIVATAFGFGLILMALVYLIGNISGCHLNPSVSLACLIDKRMSFKEFLAYVLAQILGGIAGAALLYGVLKATGFSKLLTDIDATNTIAGTGWQGYVGTIIFEMLLTFIFVMVILKLTKKEEHNKFAGLIIGLTLTLVHLIGIGVTGTSVNPARSFGPALMSYAFKFQDIAIKEVWVFFVGPLLGGALAGLVEMFCKKETR